MKSPGVPLLCRNGQSKSHCRGFSPFSQKPQFSSTASILVVPSAGQEWPVKAKMSATKRAGSAEHRQLSPAQRQQTRRDMCPYLIWHRFEEDGRSGDFLLVCHEAMGEVTPIRQVQPHDAPMGFHQCSVHCKICRRAWKWQICV